MQHIELLLLVLVGLLSSCLNCMPLCVCVVSGCTLCAVQAILLHFIVGVGLCVFVLGSALASLSIIYPVCNSMLHRSSSC